MSKIIEKRLASEQDLGLESIDEPKSPRMDLYQTNGAEKSSPKVSPYDAVQSPATGLNGAKDKMSFKEPTKKKIQLSFENVVIKTVPPRKRCANKNTKVEPAKIILDNVSGCI